MNKLENILAENMRRFCTKNLDKSPCLNNMNRIYYENVDNKQLNLIETILDVKLVNHQMAGWIEKLIDSYDNIPLGVDKLYGISGKINAAINEYIKILDSKSDLIKKLVLAGKVADTYELYFSTFKTLYYKKVNEISWVTKTAISKLISKSDFEKRFSIHRISEILRECIRDVVGMLYSDAGKYKDPMIKREISNVYNNRRITFAEHIQKWTISQIYE